MKYSVHLYHPTVVMDYFEVEADSKEEALELVQCGLDKSGKPIKWERIAEDEGGLCHHCADNDVYEVEAL